jgi:outer membrane lipoprotein-sorting protein
MRRSLVAVLFVLALSAPAFADATGDAVKALIGFNHLSSYHMHFTTPAGKTMDVDIVNPNKMRMVSGPTQMVRIGDSMWVYVNGHWMAMPAMAAGSMSQMTGGVTAARTLGEHATRVTVTDLGMKGAGHAYLVKDPDMAGNTTIYVGGDGYVHEMDVVDNQGHTSTILISQFNQPITIDPPA